MDFQFISGWKDIIDPLYRSVNSVAIGIFDDNGSLTDANPAMCYYLATGDNDLSPKHSVVNPEFQTLLNNQNEGLIFEGVITIGDRQDINYVFTAKIFRRAGALMIFAHTDAPLLFRENKKLSNLNQEIHNLQRQLIKEKKLLYNSNEQYQAILQNALDCFLVLDTEGKIIDVNNSFSILSGYNRQELLKMNALHLAAGNAEFWSKITNNIEEGPQRFESEFLSRNGSVLEFEICMNYLPAQQIFFIFMQDITQKKKSESALQEIKIAHESLKFKQNFLANMSHEIRTPLTGVLGMLEMLEKTPLTPKQADYLNVLKISGGNLREIINQILDYSKIEEGKLSIKPITFNFDSLFTLADSLFTRHKNPNVILQRTVGPDIPEIIFADKMRISQVVNNLVSNALKFTYQGTIVIRSHVVSITGTKIVIKIEVEDTGIGIPEDMYGKLFIPFSQVDEKDTRQIDGTGLGLSICKELVKLLGGEIGFSSTHKKGSTFWFTFPAMIAVETKSIQPEAPVDEIPAFKLKILLVEDKLINQKVISLQLKSLGHEVSVAGNGAEAVQLFKPGKFDLILMDIQMPVMDGISATTILKEKYPELPPIVCLSANAFEGDREKYMALGMDEYLSKPLQTKSFNLLMGKLLQHKKRPFGTAVGDDISDYKRKT